MLLVYVKKELLIEEEIELFWWWIEQGVEYLFYWSYVVLKRVNLLEVMYDGWFDFEIDVFVVDKLQLFGVLLSGVVDMRIFMRRLVFDLIGLLFDLVWME